MDGDHGCVWVSTGHCKVIRVTVNPAALSDLLASAQQLYEQIQDQILSEDTTHNTGMVRPQVREPGGTGRRWAQSPAQPEGPSHVILVADKHLLELPLEGLSVLHEGAASSVSREFSLQMLFNRLHREEPGESCPGTSGFDFRMEMSQVLSRQENGVLRVVPPDCITIDSDGFRFLQVPGSEPGLCLPPILPAEMVTPVSVTRDILERFQETYTLRWSGHLGNQNCPSQAEWEQALGSCRGFFFYGMESFLSHILVERLVAMNLQECQMMVLLHLTRSYESLRRHKEVSENKSTSQLSLEKPVQTAILLSLVGVQSIVANQWPTSLQDNALRASVLWDNLLALGKPIGKTVRLLQKMEGSEMDSRSQDLAVPLQPVPSVESFSTTLGLVLYGLPNQAIV
uniref:Cilia and flagella associated protein 46 n=1 Tax=Spermophilus dauricus TaxID=99837 RepID=A0A8C9QTF6_SPEDA